MSRNKFNERRAVTWMKGKRMGNRWKREGVLGDGPGGKSGEKRGFEVGRGRKGGMEIRGREGVTREHQEEMEELRI